MALTDVTDAMFDPDFADELLCERIEEIVGENGLASHIPTQIRFYACVTVDKPDALYGSADGRRIAGAITVHTAFQLFDGRDGLTADELIFRGRRYTVAHVSDYSHFGQGFVAATCDLLPLTGGPQPDPHLT